MASAPLTPTLSPLRRERERTWLLAALLFLSACRTPRPPVPEPLPPPPPPIELIEEVPEPPPVSRNIELDPHADSLNRLQREVIFDGGLAETQTFPEPYSEHAGIFTFRGGPRRSGGAWGVIPREPHELSIA